MTKTCASVKPRSTRIIPEVASTPLEASYLSPVWAMSYGVKRRELLLERLKAGSIYINLNHCLNLRYDLDLQKLLKSGKVKRTRTSRGSLRCRATQLSLD